MDIAPATSPATPAMSPFKFEYLRGHTSTFEAVSAWRSATYDVGTRGTGGTATVLRVSDDFFDVVGARPVSGRAFSDDELGRLLGVIIAINAWNRVGVGTGLQPEVAA